VRNNAAGGLKLAAVLAGGWGPQAIAGAAMVRVLVYDQRVSEVCW
jgi:hypothetical protein